ncbi:hypothetical protein CEXT_48151 [Caerostris extrusa]|uniref:Uncharacterized protein n=1 Tax=Caerostris extrusa TaxID=172846 RepID=A0AAV4VFX3_CAEEX|nr:hypothetical protein CEXT_48151 [Caerostris extrusa]
MAGQNTRAEIYTHPSNIFHELRKDSKCVLESKPFIERGKQYEALQIKSLNVLPMPYKYYRIEKRRYSYTPEESTVRNRYPFLSNARHCFL